MKKSILVSLFENYENDQYLIGKTECWHCRRLMELMECESFHDFLGMVNKAQQLCSDLGVDPSMHFFPITNQILKLNVKYKTDMLLSGFACFCIAEVLPFTSDAIVVAKAYFYGFRGTTKTNVSAIQKHVSRLENQQLKYYLYS